MDDKTKELVEACKQLICHITGSRGFRCSVPTADIERINQAVFMIEFAPLPRDPITAAVLEHAKQEYIKHNIPD